MVLKYIAQRVLAKVVGWANGQVAIGISKKNTQIVLICEDWPGAYCELLDEPEQILAKHHMLESEDIDAIIDTALSFIHNGEV